jgi:DNA-directed RNA polymerase specialized sigma24 family protein
LIDLAADLRTGGEPRVRARTEVWVLLRDALVRVLRVHASSVRAIHADDLEDIASTKALELILRVESGAWDPRGRQGGEVAAYVGVVARHALWRWAGQSHRLPRAAMPDEGGEFTGRAAFALAPDTAECTVEAREFVEALRDCVDRLAPRARRVWFFRAYYDLSSLEIAAHPEVGLNAPHVDVLVGRVRELLRTCLARHGHSSRDLPEGAYATLWEGLAGLEKSREAQAVAGDVEVL